MLSDLLGTPRQFEILVIILIGIIWLSLDPSLFTLKSDIDDIWTTPIYPEYLENQLKIFLSALVLARTLSLHVFLAMYVVMLWPAIFEDKPTLLLPWLVLGSIRSIFLNGLALFFGIFSCYLYRGINLVCADFLLAQIIEHGPSVYAWFSVYWFYKELNAMNDRKRKSSIASQDIAVKRKKAKCMSISFWEQDPNDILRHIITDPDSKTCLKIECLIRQMSSNSKLTLTSRSLDSLLSVLDDKETCQNIFNAFEDCALKPKDKAKAVLDINDEDILKVKRDRDKMQDVISSIRSNDLDNLASKAPNLSTKHNKNANHFDCKLMNDCRNQELCKMAKCRCYLKELDIQKSNLTIHESELATIDLDGTTQNMVNKSVCASNKYAEKTPEVRKPTYCESGIQNHVNKSAGPSLGFRKMVAQVVKTIENRQHNNNFSCQVSPIDNRILQVPRKELTKKLEYFKKLTLLGTLEGEVNK